MLGGWLWQAHQIRAQRRQIDVALEQRELVGAADQLGRFLERFPHDAEALFLAARTTRRLGRFREAEAFLERYQRQNGVTDATRLEWDLLRVQQGDVGDIALRLRSTVAPDHPDALIVLEALAKGYQAAGRLRDVMEACDLWIMRRSDDPSPWLWRGEVFEQLNNYQAALADYRHALEVAPESREVRLALGGLHARARQPAEAAEHFSHLLDHSPDDPDARMGLAACHLDQGQAADATLLLAPLLAKDNAPPRAWLLRGKAALEQHDAKGAERWLERAAREAPDDPEALHLLLAALRSQGKHGAADALTPRLEAVRADRMRLSELIRVIARTPDDAVVRHEAGVIALRLGRSDEGVRWLQSALRAKGDHRPTHAALASHFANQGDPRGDWHRRLAQASE